MKKWIWIENLIQLFGSKMDLDWIIKIQSIIIPRLNLQVTWVDFWLKSIQLDLWLWLKVESKSVQTHSWVELAQIRCRDDWVWAEGQYESIFWTVFILTNEEILQFVEFQFPIFFSEFEILLFKIFEIPS